MKNSWKALLMGGLLGVSLLLNNQEVNASSSSIKSQGVLKLQDSSGKNVIIDAKDFDTLNSKIDNLGSPKLKITYHQHTDDCYKALGWGKASSLHFPAVVHVSGYASTPTSVSNVTSISKGASYFFHCNAHGSLCAPNELNTSAGYANTATYAISSVNVCRPDSSYAYTGMWRIPVAGLTYACPCMNNQLNTPIDRVTKIGDLVLTCGKDETTIESIELVTE